MFVTFNPESETGFELHEGTPTLAVMQEAVGGLIEPVDVFGDEDGVVSMYVNEEGLYLCEPTLILTTENYGDQVINGPVIFARMRFSDGETVPLTQEDVDKVIEAYKGARLTSVGFLTYLEFLNG